MSSKKAKIEEELNYINQLDSDDRIFYICNTDKYKNLLSEPYEKCGIFEMYTITNIGKCLQSSHETDGYIVEGRGACVFEKESQIVWHTHPNTLIKYPSKEDVWKVLKSKTIKISLIITSWGIWQLNNLDTVYILKDPILKNGVCVENCNDYFFMEEIERNLYNETKTGRVETISKHSQRAMIKEYIRNVEKYKGLKVFFTSWDIIFDYKYPIKF